MNQLLRRIFQNGTNFVSVICNTHFEGHGSGILYVSGMTYSLFHLRVKKRK